VSDLRDPKTHEGVSALRSSARTSLAAYGHLPVADDLQAALWSDPVATRYIGGKVLTPEESWSQLLRYPGHWAGVGVWVGVVEEKATGDFVGEVGFADYRREVEPRLSLRSEMCRKWGGCLFRGSMVWATEPVYGVWDWCLRRQSDTYL